MGQKRFLMSQRELQRYHVINKVVEGRMTTLEAAESLNLSRRQVFRLKTKVVASGPEGIIHGNRGRVPITTKPKGLMKTIRDLYQKVYKGFNITHFTEKLNEIEGIDISRETVRKHLRGHNLIDEMRHAPKHRSRRERMPMVGMMLQHDTSEHDWLEGRGPEIKLIASIDDANNEVPFALFVEADGTLPNMEVMKQVIKLKGIPMKFYVDGASYNKTYRREGIHYNLKGKYKETQIERALGELGINLIIAGSPQAKGRIERLFGTFQDRLISEMRLKKISTREDANRFLHEEFLPDHNMRFTVSPAKEGSAYRKLPSGINLDSIFCIKQERTVQRDNTISYRGRIFQIIPQNGRMSYTRAKVEVQEWTNRTIHVLYKGKELATIEIPEKPKRLTEKPKRFNLKDFLRKEVEPQTEFYGVT
ncbi:MAG: ISNCY family transposase [Nitrospirota bacterium]